jgi:protein-S-isoprenylcysteine O-methyltransferase Ste14
MVVPAVEKAITTTDTKDHEGESEAAIFRSLYLMEYAALMLLVAHVFVVLYEEPTLRREFGVSYEEYRRKVPRWIPRVRGGNLRRG